MQHISVECPFCYGKFIMYVLDYLGEQKKYKINRDVTCPHCQRGIVVGSKLLVIDPVSVQKPRREVKEYVDVDLPILDDAGDW